MTPPNPYDLVPYRTRPRRATHPETAITLAMMMGLNPAPVTACRVLEIGCGTGGNLIAVAETLPGSTFLGIDPSDVQIDLARKEAAALGLTNVTFEPIGVGDLAADAGPFDVIICHGVYSWVPPAVQTEILAACGRLLAPHGAAVISYNTYPGWHLRRFARGAMLFISRRSTDAAEQIKNARGYLQFISESILDRDSSWCKIVADEQKLVAGADDFYLFHEHLEEFNTPCHFYEFAERARGHGLQYLGEAGHHPMHGGIPDETREVLQRISKDLIDLEQHIDFLRNRTFRHTVLVRDDAPVTRQLPAGLLDRLLLRVAAEPAADITGKSLADAVTYLDFQKVEMTTSAPLINAILFSLGAAFPRTLSLEALRIAVVKRFETERAAEAGEASRQLPKAVLNLYEMGFVSLHTWHYPLAATVSEHPRGWPVAMRIAAVDANVPTLVQLSAALSPLARFVLLHCDGTRTEADLQDLLNKAAKEEAPGAGPIDPAAAIRDSLARLANHALLIS